MSDGLIITVEGGSGQRFVTGSCDDSVLVGRSPMADLRLVDAAVSAVHVKLVAGQGVVRAQDLGSKNGTFLDDHQLAPQQLVEVRPGSVLDVGATFRLTFSWGEIPAAAENPFAQAEIEEDDGTARLHPAALLALREKLDRREEASARPGGHSPAKPQAAPLPAFPSLASPPPVSRPAWDEPSPQPPSLELPWSGNDPPGAPPFPPTAAPLAVTAKPTSGPAQRGRISIGGTADAASFGAAQALQEPGSATVARVRAPVATDRPAPDALPASASSSFMRAERPPAMPVATPIASYGQAKAPLEPPGDLRVRLSTGEELGAGGPKVADTHDAVFSQRRPEPSRTTGHRRVSKQSPRQTGSRRALSRRRDRPWLIPVIVAAAVAMVGAFVWLALHLVTSSGDAPAPTPRHRMGREER